MLKELQKLVSNGSAILYEPLNNEVDYRTTSFPLQIPTNNFIIPKDKTNDPFKWIKFCISKFKKSKVFILIPGTAFDAHGTRHGKGGGWYDRFLSKAPDNWIRIGLVNQSGFSDQPILKEEWDQPVDWVIVKDNLNWRIIKSQKTP